MNSLEEQAQTPDQSVSKPKSNLAIAEEILTANGIQGRARTMLELSLVSVLTEDMARAVLEQKPRFFDNNLERSMIERDIQEANADALDPLWTNREVWEGRDLLSFDYLDHTFTGRKGEMVTEAKVVYLLSTLTFGSWGKTRGEAYTETVDSHMEAQLQDLARRTASSQNWDEIVAVADGFANSPLAEQVHRVAEVWNERYFDPRHKPGSAVDDLLETHVAIQNPDAVMGSARQIYKAAFGLDLDHVRPVEKSS